MIVDGTFSKFGSNDSRRRDNVPVPYAIVTVSGHSNATNKSTKAFTFSTSWGSDNFWAFANAARAYDKHVFPS